MSTPNPIIVTMPSPEVEFILGPQARSGASTASGAAWFDQNAISRGLALCGEFPDAAHTPGNVLISGTVAVANGSKIVIGSGTKFLSEARDYAIIQNGSKGRIVKIVGSVQSDTQLTLTLEWEGDTVSGQLISSPTGSEVDTYQGYLNYYDFGLVAYTNYYRTGDQRFLDCARKVTDSWWSQPVIDYGHQRIENSLAPRSIAMNGLILRALDGHPEMWPWITDYVRTQFANWVSNMTGNTTSDRATYPGFYFGVRDGGFMLLYAANLAKVHPDPPVRDEFRMKALHGAVDYYARLQQADGSYRWNDDDFPFSGSGQPFQVGILNEGMIAVHRLTGDERVKTAILKSAEHEFSKSYNPNGWRAVYYFIHGTIGSPAIGCESGCGNASNAFPPTDISQISEARQLNATLIHLFGYAYSITGDSRFRQWGDELFDSTYSGSDGYRGLAAYRGKEYDESYRTGGKYLAWREGVGAATPPTPIPVPVPAPIPVPIPAPTPAPTTPTTYQVGGTVTKDGSPTAGVVVTMGDTFSTSIGTMITDSSGRYVGNINAGQKGVVLAPQGYLPTSYIFDGAGTKLDLNFSVVSPAPVSTPTPPPVPTPAPTPPRLIAWPKQIAKQNQLIEAQWNERYRLRAIQDGIHVIGEFEKVK